MALTAVTFFSPVFAAAWALRWLARRPHLKRTLITASVVANVFFVSVTLLVAFDEDALRTNTGGSLGAEILPGCFELRNADERLCRFAPGSEMERRYPGATYLVASGHVRVRLEADPSTKEPVSVSVTDRMGRTWVDLNLDEGTLLFNQYASNAAMDPEASLMDLDGDGVPDTRVDWVRGERHWRVGPVEWQERKPENGH